MLGACRQNNVDLLRQVVGGAVGHGTKEDSVLVVRTAQDALGNTALHIACKYGSLECVDYLLDQPNIDLDTPNRIDGDTPLHLAVRHANDDLATAIEIVEFLIDAGADANSVNKTRSKPIDLVPSGQKALPLRAILERAGVAEQLKGDVVSLDDLDEDVVGDSASDSG